MILPDHVALPLAGQWESFRGDTAVRDMHPDLITRLELGSHATQAIAGRRDRTGPLHSEWFQGPGHRNRAEAQAEHWARQLLSPASAVTPEPITGEPAP